MNVRSKRTGIARLTLDRPDRLNAMSDAMWDALLRPHPNDRRR